MTHVTYSIKMKLNFQEGVEGPQDLKPSFLLLS